MHAGAAAPRHAVPRGRTGGRAEARFPAGAGKRNQPRRDSGRSPRARRRRTAAAVSTGRSTRGEHREGEGDPDVRRGIDPKRDIPASSPPPSGRSIYTYILSERRAGVKSLRPPEIDLDEISATQGDVTIRTRRAAVATDNPSVRRQWIRNRDRSARTHGRMTEMQPSSTPKTRSTGANRRIRDRIPRNRPWRKAILAAGQRRPRRWARVAGTVVVRSAGARFSVPEGFGST